MRKLFAFERGVAMGILKMEPADGYATFERLELHSSHFGHNDQYTVRVGNTIAHMVTLIGDKDKYRTGAEDWIGQIYAYKEHDTLAEARLWAVVQSVRFILYG